MNVSEVKNLINEGENSSVEFKSAPVSNEELAITMVSFLNGQGGVILLGVEDDGTLTGIEDVLDKKLNAINQVAQNRVKPAIIPILDTLTINNKSIISITLEKGIQKPYYLIKNEKTLFYIRVGTTSRLASPEQIAVLYANHPFVHYDISPLPDMLANYLDERRIHHYFIEIKKLTEKYYQSESERLWLNARLLVKLVDKTVATLAGGLLFGREPSRFIPSAGIRCAAFDGKTKDYAMSDKKFLDAPLLPYERDGIPIEYGLIEQAIQFIESNTKKSSIMQGIKRIDQSTYPLETLREVITNALIHRDYSLQGGQIQVLIFSDRLEIRSPGKLPNTLTIDMIKNGASYTRNPVLMKFAENYGYVEHLGMGIPEKVIKPMLKQGYPSPELIDNGYEFIVILKREAHHTP
jgi:ATP-dependent DNA helicase RecG